MWPSASALEDSVNSFLENMFCATKTSAATNEAEMPQKLVEKPLEHANMTPAVRGIQGQVRRPLVPDPQNHAVGQDCEERRKTFDRVDH